VGRIAELVERDGSACVWCGRELWHADLTLEHLLPRSRRGHTTAENLAVACRRCNRARGTQAVSAYVRTLLDAGQRPRLETLRAALERLAASERRAHATYGARQLELIDRLARTAPTH
jgi:5-methylcytosine-specific restriction endonuclease McrA